MIEFDLIDANDFRLTASLDDKLYVLRFMWNSEAGFWTMAVEDVNRVTLLAGVKLVPYARLISMFHYLALPPGEFLVTGDTDRMAFVEKRGHLYYLPEAELATL